VLILSIFDSWPYVGREEVFPLWFTATLWTFFQPHESPHRECHHHLQSTPQEVLVAVGERWENDLRIRRAALSWAFYASWDIDQSKHGHHSSTCRGFNLSQLLIKACRKPCVLIYSFRHVLMEIHTSVWFHLSNVD